MSDICISGKTYPVDQDGYLLNFDQWDESFAEFLAPRHSISGGLTQKHWQVIYFIRSWFKETGLCPLVYKTCRTQKLSYQQLQALFPTGYLRGACKMAGISYVIGFHGSSGHPQPPAARQAAAGAGIKPAPTFSGEKTYQVDVFGFLVDPANWDSPFAVQKAVELKMKDGLTPRHWQIIGYLRDQFLQTGTIPTVYSTCAAFQLKIGDLEELFPDGYHRGAVKIAGLRAISSSRVSV